MLTTEALMTTSSTPEDTIAECRRRVRECYALLESTIVPEYRQALSAMDEDRSKRGNNPRKIDDDARSLASFVEVES
jgi:hypothetical protein